jgi:hypothetical protein
MAKEQERVRWRVLSHQTSVMRAYVEASTKEEAEALAREIGDGYWDFDDVVGETTITSVEPVEE